MNNPATVSWTSAPVTDAWCQTQASAIANAVQPAPTTTRIQLGTFTLPYADQVQVADRVRSGCDHVAMHQKSLTR